MRRRRIMQQMQGGELPSGYVRCKYLESSGKQCIDTTIQYESISKIEHICNISITKIGTRQIIGDWYGRYFGITADGYYEIGGGVVGDKVIIGEFAQINNTFEPYVNRLTVNNKTIMRQYTTKACKKYFLFCAMDENVLKCLAFAKLKKSTINIDDTLARNFTPALDPSGRPCMYDTVTQQPFYNQGTGEFGYELPDGTYVAPI